MRARGSGTDVNVVRTTEAGSPKAGRPYVIPSPSCRIRLAGLDESSQTPEDRARRGITGPVLARPGSRATSEKPRLAKPERWGRMATAREKNVRSGRIISAEACCVCASALASGDRGDVDWPAVDVGSGNLPRGRRFTLRSGRSSIASTQAARLPLLRDLDGSINTGIRGRVAEDVAGMDGGGRSVEGVGLDVDVVVGRWGVVEEVRREAGPAVAG